AVLQIGTGVVALRRDAGHRVTKARVAGGRHGRPNGGGLASLTNVVHPPAISLGVDVEREDGAGMPEGDGDVRVAREVDGERWQRRTALNLPPTEDLRTRRTARRVLSGADARERERLPRAGVVHHDGVRDKTSHAGAELTLVAAAPAEGDAQAVERTGVV